MNKISIFVLLVLFTVASCAKNLSKPDNIPANNSTIKVPVKSLTNNLLSNVIGNVKYYYVKVVWEGKKSGRFSYNNSTIEDTIGVLYGGIDKGNKWIAMVAPVIYMEKSSLGISLIFIRSDKKWKFSYVKPMKLVKNIRNGYNWISLIDYSILAKDDNKYSLKVDDSCHYFSFTYNGKIDITNDKRIKQIKIEGISIPSLNKIPSLLN